MSYVWILGGSRGRGGFWQRLLASAGKAQQSEPRMSRPGASGIPVSRRSTEFRPSPSPSRSGGAEAEQRKQPR